MVACLQQAVPGSTQRQQQHGGGAGSSAGPSWTVSTGAELAALAHLALTGQLDAAELAVTREHLSAALLWTPSALLAGCTAGLHTPACGGTTHTVVVPAVPCGF